MASTKRSKLSILVSDDLGDYATGKKSAAEVHCALCQCAPCRCPAFGTPAYFALLDQRHGRSRGGRKDSK